MIARSRLTERLRLEPITRERADDLWKLHRDPAVAEYYVEEARWSRDDAQRCAAAFEADWQAHGVSKWLAYDRVDGTLVGRGGLSTWSFDGYEGLEVGWALLGAFRGRGLATEIGRAGIALAFAELGASKVVAFTEVHNRPSRAVMERLGMRYAGDIAWRGLIEGLDGVHEDAPFALYQVESATDAIATQARYYDLFAPDYVNPLAPSNRRAPGVLEPTAARDLIDDLAPKGDVLELACGPGGFTAELARHATTVTAIDASRQMLARNRAEVDLPNVRYIQADLFDWRPARAYDVVFFGFWLSHVPPTRFDDFWQLVRTCVRDDGRVAFVDESDRSKVNDDVRIVGGVPLAGRALADGSTLDVIKLFWNPEDLANRLRALGWTFGIRRVHDIFMYGVGTHEGV